MRSLLALLCFALPASAADLTKIDRAIAKLPKLTSKDPKYFFVVVGQDPAKGKTMLGIVDDDKLHLDFNGNRDLTDDGEPITSNGFWNAKLKMPGQDFEHTLKVRMSSISLTLPDGLEQTVFFRGSRFKWGKDAASAPVVHLGGPLTLHPGWNQSSISSRHGAPFVIALGTPGIGDQSMAILPSKQWVSEKRYVAVDIDYPRRDGSGIVRVSLKLDRTDGIFAGIPLFPHREAGPGLAHIRLQLVGWDDIRVPVETFDMPVLDD